MRPLNGCGVYNSLARYKLVNNNTVVSYKHLQTKKMASPPCHELKLSCVDIVSDIPKKSITGDDVSTIGNFSSRKRTNFYL